MTRSVQYLYGCGMFAIRSRQRVSSTAFHQHTGSKIYASIIVLLLGRWEEKEKLSQWCLQAPILCSDLAFEDQKEARAYSEALHTCTKERKTGKRRT